MMDHFEIWDEDRWSHYQRENAGPLDDLRERLAAEGRLAMRKKQLNNEASGGNASEPEHARGRAHPGPARRSDIPLAPPSWGLGRGRDNRHGWTRGAAAGHGGGREPPARYRSRPRSPRARGAPPGALRRPRGAGARQLPPPSRDRDGRGRGARGRGAAGPRALVVSARRVGARVLVPGRGAARHALRSERGRHRRRAARPPGRRGDRGPARRVRRGAARPAHRARARGAAAPQPAADRRRSGLGGEARGAARRVVQAHPRGHPHLPGGAHGGQRRARRARGGAAAGRRAARARRPSRRHLVPLGRGPAW